MLHVDVACRDTKCDTATDTVSSKEPGQASQEASHSRAKLDLNADETRIPVCTEI